MPTEVIAELEAALETMPQQGDPPSGGLRHTADFVDHLTDRLVNGPGIVVISGMPVEDEVRARGLLWAFGRVMGQPVPQDPEGTLIERVEHRGDPGPGNYNGHQLNKGLAFHVDRTDLIALLSMRTAQVGGLSLVASSLTMHDILLEEHPDLLEELYRPFPHGSGTGDAAEQPWYGIPIFAQVDGRLIVHYIRRSIESSQQNPAAPRLTERQRRAMDAVDEIFTREEVVLSMDLLPGDLQILNNFSVLHSRTGFANSPDKPGRLLLRLWLSFAQSPRLPTSYATYYSNSSPGAVRGGVWPSDLSDMIGRPVMAAR